MSIQVNIEKSRDIWRDKWREARKPLLEALDVEFMRAVEDDDRNKQTEIKQKKQELRDVTNTVLEDINEVHQLKWVWPNCLGDK